MTPSSTSNQLAEIERHKQSLQAERIKLMRQLQRMGYIIHTPKEAEALARKLTRKH